MKRRGSRAPESEDILAVPHAGRDVPAGVRQDLEIVSGGERIPAVLLLPHASAVPAALLLHGLGSRKERMIDTVGSALVPTMGAVMSLTGRPGFPIRVLQSPNSCQTHPTSFPSITLAMACAR